MEERSRRDAESPVIRQGKRRGLVLANSFDPAAAGSKRIRSRLEGKKFSARRARDYAPYLGLGRTAGPVAAGRAGFVQDTPCGVDYKRERNVCSEPCKGRGGGQQLAVES